MRDRGIKHELRIMVFAVLSIILYSLFMIHPVYAKVEIGEKFGFGDIISLGNAISKLVMPAFSVSAAAVVIYFLLGAFKYLMSAGKKEEIEGARNMIFHSIIGFILLMFAFLILQFLLSRLFNIREFGIIGI